MRVPVLLPRSWGRDNPFQQSMGSGLEKSRARRGAEEKTVQRPAVVITLMTATGLWRTVLSHCPGLTDSLGKMSA